MRKNTGGPAFPHAFQEMDGQGMPRTQAYFQEGMTLRDYFATAELSKVDGCSINDIDGAYKRVAEHCYRMADAMLAERDK